MVTTYLVRSAVTSISEESATATVIDQDNKDMQRNRDNNDNLRQENNDLENNIELGKNGEVLKNSNNLQEETALRKYSHEDFDELVEEDTRGILENNENSPQETAIETYSHEDFDELVEEETHKIRENMDSFPKDSAIETSSHEDFDNLIRMEVKNQHREDGSKSSQESAIIESSHEDFDNLVHQEERPATNINIHTESAFEKESHEAFDKLVQTEAHMIDEDNRTDRYETHKSDDKSNEEVDKIRQDVTAHHSKNGLRKPADTTSLSPLPDKGSVVSTEKPDRTATTSPRPPGDDPEVSVAVSENLVVIMNPHPSQMDADVSVAVPQDIVATVTTPSLPPDVNTKNSNSLFNPNANTEVMAIYLAFLLVMAAVGIFFLSDQLKRRRRANKQKWEIYQYIGKFDIEDIDLRRAITGGWHGQYKNDLARGHDGESLMTNLMTYCESDDDYRSCDSDLDPDAVESAIVFMEQNDLSSPIPSKKRPVPLTMLIGERNMYLDDVDESTDDENSDDDDIFAAVRTRPF